VNPQASPEIKNVTPLAVAAKPLPPRLLIAGAGALIVLLGLVFFAFSHHANRYESIADDVTKAIANNDMTPVAQDFNAIRRPELADRARVGKLSDMVIALGAFKGSTEITPAGSAAGFHEFTETFANGTLDEKYELDSDGKIVRFHIGPKPTP
jgi:hypothetical protein